MSNPNSNYLVLAGALILAVGAGCSGDGPTSPDPGNSYRLAAPLENAVAGVPLTADQPTTVTLTLQLPPDIPRVAAATIDVAATLDHVQIDGIPLYQAIVRKTASRLGLAEEYAAMATLRVGSDPATVCTTGIPYGPFQVSHGTSLVVSPETVAADEATLEVINLGTLIVCITITPNFDALLSVQAVAMDITEGDCEAPADFAGTWAGSFQCEDSCSGPWSGSIVLVIEQDGDEVGYTDTMGDTFVGKVCGAMARFEHQGDEFTERGTLTLTGPDTAVKRSTWRMNSYPFCGGDCHDTLTRQTSVRR